MALLIGLLGPLVIEIGDRRLGKVPRKARALLAYLAAQGGRAVSRERLADLLWPYQGSDQARHSLRNCLLELRKALGPGAKRHLAAEFANCRLQDIDLDVQRFERLSRSSSRAELTVAAELYRGEFLADFVIDSEPFQEWLAAERDRTLDLICGVLQRLTAMHDDAGEHDLAIQSARRLAGLDSLSEIGQRALIRAYARAGRRPEALRQYRICADILKRELGVAPDAETQALANQIARSGGAAEPAANGRTHDQPAVLPNRGELLPGLRGTATTAAPEADNTRLRWPCLLSGIALAVAPMRNLTGDPDQQYLMEAFSEDLVTDLLRHGRGLALVPVAEERGPVASGPVASGPVARTSRAGEAGSEYLVTGSAQRSGARILRVNVQITDAASAGYLWAARYEFDPQEVGPAQTRITRQISREIHALLLREDSRRALTAAGNDPSVNECLAQAASALQGKLRAELTAEAQRWFLAALALDARNVEALTGLAKTCQHLVSQPWWGDSGAAAAALDLGQQAIATALQLAPGRAVAKCVQGMLYSAAGQLDEAAEAFQSALTLDHRLASAHAFSGYNAAFLGHAEETLPAVERAMRLDQTDRRHSIFFFFGGFAELLLGRPEVSIALLQKSLERNPSYGGAQLFLIASLALLGRRGEAARAVTAFREHYPESRANAFEQLWLSRSACPAYRTQINPVFEKIRSLGVGG
jgi:DNA-binding SARP family transcriptional activator/TolB-like protein/Tfp pilus assembly protein PilF